MNNPSATPEPQAESELSADEAIRSRLRSGGVPELSHVWSEYRSRLERIVEFRMSPVLRSRLDATDVLQEAFLNLSRRLPEFVNESRVPFYVWIRQQTLQTLIDLQRNHFRDKRDPMRERAFSVDATEASSLSIAQFVLDDGTSPSIALQKSEEFIRLHAALESMNETDREVLALRHFEQWSNQQVAELLQISPTAASNRYIRAMVRLGEILKSVSQAPL